MKAIGDLLSKNIQKAGIKRQVDAALAVELLAEILTEVCGPAAAQKCHGLYVKNRILMIACLSSVLAQEIKNQETVIIPKLNQRLRSSVVDSLRFIS